MGNFRYDRNLALLVNLESIYGVEHTVWGATNAILLTEQPTFEFDWMNIDRDLILPYYGASEQIPATAKVVSKFKTELVASGTAGTPPAIGPLLIACGMEEIITAGARVEYKPRSQGQAGITQRFFNDGVRYISKGGRGKVKLDMSVAKIPTAEFEFWSFGRSEVVDSIPNLDYGGFKLPEAVVDANSGDVKFGSTYANGNLTGGVSYKSKGLTVSIENKLEHYINLGGEDIGLSDRKVTGEIMVALSEEEELQWLADIRAVTPSTVSFSHGTAVGKRIAFFGRRVQRYNMNRASDNGRLMFKSSLGYIPDERDNEFILVFR